MKRILLVAMLIILGLSAGCSSALTHGDRTSDDSHAFLLHITQIADQIDQDSTPEGDVFLVVKYEIENLGNQMDPQRQWTDQIRLEAGDDLYEPIPVESLTNEMWGTSLLAGEAKTGYIAYIVPDDVEDFKLTFTFPDSGNEVVYKFRPVDRRISENAKHVLTRLEQIEKTERIPVIGGLLASLSSAPIRYLGTVLVPEEEISQLLEQTRDLSEDAKRALVEGYLLARGHGKLE